MKAGFRRGAAVAALLTIPGGTWAQAPADACALLTRGEFEALTGKTEHVAPSAMPWDGATVCGFENGQILLFGGSESRTDFDRLLAAFGQQDLLRSPVEGLGEGAFSLVYDPADPYQDHGAFVVFGAGPPTIAVTVYADEGQPAESALPAALRVAKAVAEKL
jgi:hypothetical protein